VSPPRHINSASSGPGGVRTRQHTVFGCSTGRGGDHRAPTHPYEQESNCQPCQKAARCKARQDSPDHHIPVSSRRNITTDLEGPLRIGRRASTKKRMSTPGPSRSWIAKTYHSMEHDKTFLKFRDNVVQKHSEMIDAWCVDTCQMWYSGLGLAYEKGGPEDVYWLIPGDFNYGTPTGQEVLGRLHDLPEIILELNQDFCIGEIATDHKQFQTTHRHLRHFPHCFTIGSRPRPKKSANSPKRPRSEFFSRLRHSFLGDALKKQMVCLRANRGHAIAGGS